MILANVFLLTAAAVGMILLIFRHRVLAGASFAVTITAYSMITLLGDHASGGYLAHPMATQYHRASCRIVAEALEHGEHLERFDSPEEAEQKGLVPHGCVRKPATAIVSQVTGE